MGGGGERPILSCGGTPEAQPSRRIFGGDDSDPHLEVAKLPWLHAGGASGETHVGAGNACTQIDTQESVDSGPTAALRVSDTEIQAKSETTQAADLASFSPFASLAGAAGQGEELVVGAGFEPA